MKIDKKRMRKMVIVLLSLAAIGLLTIILINGHVARCKDFAMCIFKPEPTFLGEVIPISGNGDLTNDK